MTFRNQPHCLTPRHLTTNHITSSHLATNHMTSYRITPQHTTSPPWKQNSLQEKHHQTERLKADAHENSVCASYWLVALRTFYRHILSLVYRFFLPWNFRLRLICALLEYIELNLLKQELAWTHHVAPLQSESQEDFCKQLKADSKLFLQHPSPIFPISYFSSIYTAHVEEKFPQKINAQVESPVLSPLRPVEEHSSQSKHAWPSWAQKFVVGVKT